MPFKKVILRFIYGSRHYAEALFQLFINIGKYQWSEYTDHALEGQRGGRVGGEREQLLRLVAATAALRQQLHHVHQEAARARALARAQSHHAPRRAYGSCTHHTQH